MFSAIIKVRNFNYFNSISRTKFEQVSSIISLKRTLFTTECVLVRRLNPGSGKNENIHELVRIKEPPHFGQIFSLDENEIEVYNSPFKDKQILNKKGLKRKSNLKNETQSTFIVNDSEKIRDNTNKTNNLKLPFKNIRNDLSKMDIVLTSVKSKQLRKTHKLISIEGKRLIHEALTAGFKPTKLFFSRLSDIENLNLPEGVELYKVPYKKLAKWSNVTTCQGVIGIFDSPNMDNIKENYNSIPLTVVCDNVRDPGNLGGILRVVTGVGCEKVILTKGCVDLWDPKVLRAAAGAHFRLPMLHSLEWNEIEDEIDESFSIYLSELSVSNKENDGSESLNEKIDDIQLFKTGFNSIDLPSECYTSVDFSKKNSVIVIGGETFGISKEAYEFAKKRNGIRIYIPMNNRIESLNTAVALGILSYEVKRQFEILSKT